MSVWVEISALEDNSKAVEVTLHVSVWVEIRVRQQAVRSSRVTLHVSVWVEIRWAMNNTKVCTVTLHVSVWVEILIEFSGASWNMSRSTWACELKFGTAFFCGSGRCHAPRERVSWNCYDPVNNVFTLVTLHVSVWVEMVLSLISFMAGQSRSTWACELKSTRIARYCCSELVTLHVSVWVEIDLKELTSLIKVCHAPRERVSWNILAYQIKLHQKRHAPRERVSWNFWEVI